jgi:integrase
MASIEKQRLANGEPRYNVHWRAGGRTMERTFRRAKDADAFKRQVEAEDANGAEVDPARGDVTFGEYAEGWLKDRRRLDGRPLAPRTRELYRSLFDRHLIKPFGPKRLNAIRTEEVRGWHSNLAARSSPVQAAKTYRLLRAILNTAVEDERIATNPCRLRGAGTERTPERPFVDVEIVLALSDAIDARYCALVLLAGFGGLRLGELIALRRGDLDLQADTVRVERQVVELKNGQRIETAPKTDAGRRTVHIPSSISAALATHLDRYCGDGDDAPVFTGPLSDGLRRGTLYKEWDKARRQAGLPEVHLHDLRHAAGTLAAQTGATTRELMARLGPASPAAAHRYQHAAERRDVHVAESLETMLRTARRLDPSSRNQPAEDPAWGNRGETADPGDYPPGVTPLKPLPTSGFPRASDGNRTRVLSLGS